MAINLIVNQLLGVSSESEINVFSDFVDGCLSLPINLPGFSYYTAMKGSDLRARETIIRKIKMTIEARREQPGLVGSNWALGRLVEEENLSDDAIADFIINLLFAGNETTAKTMLFAVYFLTHCPKALEHLRAEQESIRMGNDDTLRWDNYKSMHSLNVWIQLKDDRISFFPSARLVNGFQIRITRTPSGTDLE